MSVVEDTMMMQRPGTKEPNLVILQAYKKTLYGAPPIPQNGGVKKGPRKDTSITKCKNKF
jgi:hypothetical protein